ncbi:beta-galactosidase trimerization domain-containing protein [Paenibacillus sp. IB182496]|uniref:Beta-galactosidase trimerization domain-containing protein n=1 Tax=Paenibacillus sabuli TaxID=2772509 RepID=A0A927GTX3_9BACL|nr:beta-galactosidase trimerization domain-containing protein [Paenibacillus sabuli]MBD2848073.1 beta-galactosidase trimerization domain-containing protein [Paenibacillus sabuli]
MRFRQVHLDFHTSEAIPSIGSDFDKGQFQAMLKVGHVDSITVFSKCHHGWAYHPSEANEIHPNLTFDLLGAQIEAAHEIGVKTPVYLSAGLDEKLARKHPEWLIRRPDERILGAPDFLTPGYHQFCMNTPYLDVLLDQIEEVVRGYDADGIFLDIVGVRSCYCQACVASLRARGEDPRDEAAVLRLGERTYATYTERVAARIRAIKPDMPIFHNGGHIRQGRRDLAHMNTHLELESLPTGGWGYDHFPLSARYAQTLGMPYLGMTGKFHTTWGEFGGYKHPAALRYETALSLANGARCSIGDQLPPSGHMDEATYAIIGEAYAEVERKERWVAGGDNVADVALLSGEAARNSLGPAAAGQAKTTPADTGAVRMLLEGHVLFDVIDTEADFSRYRVLILPDVVRLSPELTQQLEAYVADGGKLLLTGESGLAADGDDFALEIGARRVGPSPYRPDYFRPDFALRSLPPAAFVMYGEGQLVETTEGGTSLGTREEPYFNRDVFHFCSHQHTPSAGRAGGPGMVRTDSTVYIAWRVFEDYATKGSLVLKELVLHALVLLLPQPTVTTELPVQGVTTLQVQRAHPEADGRDRYVHHLLYASPVKRGDGIEVIEQLVPVHEVQSTLRLPGTPSRVYLAPQEQDLPYETVEGGIRYTLPRLDCHQMVVVEMG